MKQSSRSFLILSSSLSDIPFSYGVNSINRVALAENKPGENLDLAKLKPRDIYQKPEQK